MVPLARSVEYWIYNFQVLSSIFTCGKTRDYSHVSTNKDSSVKLPRLQHWRFSVFMYIWISELFVHNNVYALFSAHFSLHFLCKISDAKYVKILCTFSSLFLHSFPIWDMKDSLKIVVINNNIFHWNVNH